MKTYFSANIHIFTDDVNFWITFVALVIVCLLIWTPATMYGHIFSCSLLGSYAAVVAMNYYLGGNLQYIILNTYRRIAVTNFRFAVIDPPFQNVGKLQIRCAPFSSWIKSKLANKFYRFTSFATLDIVTSFWLLYPS